MKTWTRIITLAGITLAIGVLANPAHAIVNGGFEISDLDLTPWTHVGGVTLQGAVKGIAPTEGENQVSMRTNIESVFMPAASAGDLSAFLGLSEGDLSAALGGTVMDGSAISQTVTYATDTFLSFDFSLGTREELPPAGGADDVAFLIIDGIATILARLSDGGFTVVGTPNGVFQPYGTFTTNFALAAGVHDIFVGIANIGTSLGRSILLVDNFLTDDVEVNIEIIPEPVTSALVAMALGAVGLSMRRRHA